MARAVKKVREREERRRRSGQEKNTPLTYIDPFDLVESPPLSSISKAIYYTYIKKMGSNRGGGMDDTTIINEEQSKEICDDLNKKHLNVLTAHVAGKQSTNVTPTQINAKKLSANTLTISFVGCEGTMCALSSVDISFNPPIKSAADAVHRIIQEGKTAMEPHCLWLVTEPLPLLIMIVVAALGYATLVLKETGLQNVVEASPLLIQKTISVLFGSFFFTVVRASFYFSIFAHTAEAVYVATMLRVKANLGYLACMKWFVLICCVGYPVTSKAMKFIGQQPKDDKLE